MSVCLSVCLSVCMYACSVCMRTDIYIYMYICVEARHIFAQLHTYTYTGISAPYALGVGTVARGSGRTSWNLTSNYQNVFLVVHGTHEA